MDTIGILDAIKQINRPAAVYISTLEDENCRIFEPVVRQVADRFKGRVDFLTFNIKVSDPIFRELFILEVPNLIGYNHNGEIARLVGNQSKDAVEGLFEMVLHDPQKAGLHLSLFDRLIRLMVGTAIMILGYAEEQSWIIMSLGIILILLAFLDRFDWAYQALMHRFRKF
jgi:hypothetical protein